MSDLDVQLDAILSDCVHRDLLTGDQALSVAEQFNRHLSNNGRARKDFPQLKEARLQKGFAWMGRRAV